MFDGKRVVARMATHDKRTGGAEQAIKSLMQSSEIDSIHLFVNSGNVDESHFDSRVKVVRNIPDRKTAWKHDGYTTWKNSILLTCDDDLVYPADYAKRMCETLKKYEYEAAICVHGSYFTRPLEGYHRSRYIIGFSTGVARDVIVNVGGTGTMAFPPNDHIHGGGIPDEWDENWYCDDLVCASRAKATETPIVRLATPKGWIVPIRGLPGEEETIFQKRDEREKEVDALLLKSHDDSPWPTVQQLDKATVEMWEAVK